MGHIVKRNLPCLDQDECKSSDARQEYSDGTSYCFSCSTYFAAEGGLHRKAKHEEIVIDDPRPNILEEIQNYSTRGFQERKIHKVTAEFFNVKVGVNSDGKIIEHYYPYSHGGYKCRELPKSFTWCGPAGGLFGKEVFQGGGKRLVITEGELDALSVAQANYEKYSKFYPVISIPSASATKELLAARDWIRSFKEVVLCLDDDEAGREATQKALKIIGIDKCKIWKPLEKDASEMLVLHGADKLLQAIWDAQPWVPSGIISKDDIWKQIVERNKIPSHPYPDCLGGINKKIKGKRKGEIALLISGTGSGKSTAVREIILDIIATTNEKVGVISLEESPGETGKKLASMQIRKNTEDVDVPEEELKQGFDEVFGDDRVVVLDHQGSIKDDSIVDQLEYMCLLGCGYLLIDHITILVSEGADKLTGNEAIDKVMNDLLRLVKRHNVWVGLVSHLRKVQSGSTSFEEGKLPTLDDIRGSGSIKQVSFDVIAMARNMNHKDEKVRNHMKMAVLKSRTVGLTGPVRGADYNQQTGRLTATSEEQFKILESEDEHEGGHEHMQGPPGGY